MKCYFTFNNDIENNKTYKEMLEIALQTARKNTTLDLYSLYDGSKEDELYSILQKYGVKVTICKLSFYHLLEHFYDNKYNEQCNFKQLNLRQVACTFMKFEIAEIEQEDEVVLYSDIDVMFLKDINNLYTKTLAAAPEFALDFDKIKNYDYFNAGIMLLNIKELKRRKEILLDMLKNKKRPYQECWDQGFFNELYKNDFDKLAVEYNWKPYWGINENAIIVHLHGFKPFIFTQNSFDFCRQMIYKFEKAFSGFMYYFYLFSTYKTDNSALDIANLARFLSFAQLNYRKRWRFTTFLFYTISKLIIKSRVQFLKPIANHFDNILKENKIYKGSFEEFEQFKNI